MSRAPPCFKGSAATSVPSNTITGRSTASGMEADWQKRLLLRHAGPVRDCKSPAMPYPFGMTFQFAYQFTQEVLQPGLRDLDCVVLTVALTSDEGDLIPAGTEGTIVSVHGDGESYVVEFAEPMGALVTAEPHELRGVKDLAV